MRFLGFHHYVTSDGKYIRKLPNEKKRQAAKRTRKLIKKVRSGEISEEQFYQRHNAWKNHALKGNCIKLCHSMDMLVEEALYQQYEEN